jgi:hypothetical protein
MGGAPIGRMVGVEFCVSAVIGESLVVVGQVDGVRRTLLGRALQFFQGPKYAL